MNKIKFGASYLDGIREAQIKHGQKLFDANHVFAVKERREPGAVGGSEITGYCDRETNISEGAYRCYIKLDKDRKVIPGGFDCNCKAGGGGEEARSQSGCDAESCSGTESPKEEESRTGRFVV